jgi:arabinofuranan 3-O-arabinosyltransferase
VRVDTLVLAAPGAGVAETAGVPLRTTGDAAPDRVEVDAADPARLLTLPQNANDAWRATLDGTELEPQRVDGWRQGWWVPAGQGGEVRFDLGPGPAFQRTLLAGAAGVLACLVLLVLPARRSGEEDRNGDEGEVGVLDLAVTLGAGGLLLGWTGLAAAAAGWAVALAVAAGRGPGRALAPGLPLVAATAMLGASLSISFEPVRGGAWASEWGQLAAFLAVVAIVAATPVTVPRVGVHRSRPR